MRFAFGDHLLDAERRELHRRGASVALEPHARLATIPTCHRFSVSDHTDGRRRANVKAVSYSAWPIHDCLRERLSDIVRMHMVQSLPSNVRQHDLLSACQVTEHPRCGQIDESTTSRPFSSLVTYTARSEIIFRHPSRCSIVVSFLIGAVAAASSAALPTSLHATGVVALSSG